MTDPFWRPLEPLPDEVKDLVMAAMLWRREYQWEVAVGPGRSPRMVRLIQAVDRFTEWMDEAELYKRYRETGGRTPSDEERAALRAALSESEGGK